MKPSEWIQAEEDRIVAKFARTFPGISLRTENILSIKVTALIHLLDAIAEKQGWELEDPK